jgi:hypothetical protein
LLPSPPPLSHPSRSRLSPHQLLRRTHTRHVKALCFNNTSYCSKQLRRIRDAIWRDDAEAVLAAILSDSRLVSQNARGTEGNDNWGPPLSYAVTAGAARVVEVLNPSTPFRMACQS